MRPVKERTKDTIKLIIIAIIAIGLIIGLLVFLGSGENAFADIHASSYNRGREGGMALYDGIKKMGEIYGFETERHTKPLRFIENKSLTIISDASVSMNFSDTGGYFDRQNLVDFVRNGYSFVIIDMMPQLLNFDEFLEDGETFEKYESEIMSRIDPEIDVVCIKLSKNGDSQESGTICYAKADMFGENSWNNDAIIQDNHYSVNIVALVTGLVSEHGYGNVYFADYFKGAETSYVADILKINVIAFLAQLVIASAIFMLAISKRFGAPIVEYSTIKRDENENVYALASLYRRTGSFDVAFDVNMEELLGELAVVSGERISPEMRGNFQYINDAIAEIIKEPGNILSDCTHLSELTKTYKKTKRKINGKRDFAKKITLIENTRRQISDGK